MFFKDRDNIATGLVIDIETTGLNEGDEIIKFAGVLFEFNWDTGELVDIVDQYQGIKDRGKLEYHREEELGPKEEKPIGGQEFDLEKIKSMLGQAELIITHNIQLVRRFICRLFPEAREKEWVETMEGFPWTDEGFPGKPVEEILQKLYSGVSNPSPIISGLKELVEQAGVTLKSLPEKLRLKELWNSFLTTREGAGAEDKAVSGETGGKKGEAIRFRGIIDPNPIRKYDVRGPSSADYSQKTSQTRITFKPQGEIIGKKMPSPKKDKPKKYGLKKAIILSGVALFVVILFIIFPLTGEEQPDERNEVGVAEEITITHEQVHPSREDQEDYIQENMRIGMPQVALNFREGPDTGHDIIKTLNPEEAFFIGGEQENWFYVVLITPDFTERGWVHKDYVDVLTYNAVDDAVSIYHIGSEGAETERLQIGMDEGTVEEILGEPEMTGDRIWYYRGSPVYFNAGGRVIGWEDRNDSLEAPIPRKGFNSGDLREVFEEEFKTWLEKRDQ